MQLDVTFAADEDWWHREGSKVVPAEEQACSFVVRCGDDASLLCVLNAGDSGWSAGTSFEKRPLQQLIERAWATTAGCAESRLEIFEEVAKDYVAWIKTAQPDWEKDEELVGARWADFAAVAIVGDQASAAWIGGETIFLIRNHSIIAETKPHTLLEDFKNATGKTDEECKDFPHRDVICRSINPSQTTEISTQSLGTLLPGDIIAIVDNSCLVSLHSQRHQTAQSLVKDAKANGADRARALLASCR
jgi:hypothetical protein